MIREWKACSASLGKLLKEIKELFSLGGGVGWYKPPQFPNIGLLHLIPNLSSLSDVTLSLSRKSCGHDNDGAVLLSYVGTRFRWHRDVTLLLKKLLWLPRGP